MRWELQHEKAWLIAVAMNKCRDMLRFRTRHPVVDIEEIKEYTKFETVILDKTVYR